MCRDESINGGGNIDFLTGSFDLQGLLAAYQETAYAGKEVPLAILCYPPHMLEYITFISKDELVYYPKEQLGAGEP